MPKIDNEKDLPKDTISCIKWCQDDTGYFGVTSWDGYFRIYQVLGNYFKLVYEMNCQIPLTCFEFYKDFNVIYAGTISGSIIRIQTQNNQGINEMKCHQGPILSIIYDEDYSLYFVFEAGKQLNIYESESFNLKSDFSFNHEIGAVNYHKGMFIVGSEERYSYFSVEDLKNNKINFRINQLQSTISVVAICPDSEYTWVGGYDGRCCFKYEKERSSATVIKAHSVESQKGYSKSFTSYQVNGANQIYIERLRTFYTYGGDGVLTIWNIDLKNMYCKEQFNAQITAADYNVKHNVFAVATGYDWSLGIHGLEKVNTPPQILLYSPQNKAL